MSPSTTNQRAALARARTEWAAKGAPAPYDFQELGLHLRCELLVRLTTEWQQRFSQMTREFRGIGRRLCSELELELRATTGDENDRLMLALVIAVQDGDRLAERVLLNHLIPNAIHHARSCRGLRSLSPADAVGTSIGATWEAIKQYKTHRTRAVRANLGMEALSIITTRLGTAVDVEYPTDDATLEVEVSRTTVASVAPQWGDDTDRDLVEVLRWAIETGTLDREEVRILARYDLGDRYDADSQESRTALAEELGVARDSLNRRVLRIRNKLIEAVRSHVQAHGAW